MAYLTVVLNAQTFLRKIAVHDDITGPCVTLDPKIKETTQTTNQIKCEWPTQCDITNSHTLKQVAVGYY